jgi:hypothetical protein
MVREPKKAPIPWTYLAVLLGNQKIIKGGREREEDRK